MGSGSSSRAEREPLLAPSYPETTTADGQPVSYSRVYGRRWLVLALFSLLGFMQGMVWNTWGPVQNSAMRAFGFSRSDIAVLVLWGPVGYLPWLLFMWLMDHKGEFTHSNHGIDLFSYQDFHCVGMFIIRWNPIG